MSLSSVIAFSSIVMLSWDPLPDFNLISTYLEHIGLLAYGDFIKASRSYKIQAEL